MKKKFSYLILLLILLLTISPVHAEEKAYNGLKVESGQNVEVNKDINGTAIYAGQTIKNDKKIKGIAIMAAEKMEINGEVDYAALAAESITINGTINKDAFIAGNQIDINENAIIKRDAVIAAAIINIKGTYNRDLTIYGENVNVDNVTINGDLTIYTDSLTIGKNVDVKGKLKYTEGSSINISDKALITNKEIIKTPSVSKKALIIETIKSTILSIIGALVVFVVLNLIAPKVFENIEKITDNKGNIGKGIAIGLAMLIGIPFVIFMLMITVFGVSLSLLLLTSYIVIMYISTILTGYIIGYLIWKKFFNKEKNPFFYGALGIIVIYILKALPFIGGIFSFISITLGYGIIFILVKNIERK